MTEEFNQPVLENHPAPIARPAVVPGLDPTDPAGAANYHAGLPMETNPPGGTLANKPQPTPVSNAGKTDELSLAVVAANAPKKVEVKPIPVNPPARFHLDYVLNGKEIHETHCTVQRAVARVSELRRLGIVPATSTVD